MSGPSALCDRPDALCVGPRRSASGALCGALYRHSVSCPGALHCAPMLAGPRLPVRVRRPQRKEIYPVPTDPHARPPSTHPVRGPQVGATPPTRPASPAPPAGPQLRAASTSGLRAEPRGLRAARRVAGPLAQSHVPPTRLQPTPSSETRATPTRLSGAPGKNPKPCCLGKVCAGCISYIADNTHGPGQFKSSTMTLRLHSLTTRKSNHGRQHPSFPRSPGGIASNGWRVRVAPRPEICSILVPMTAEFERFKRGRRACTWPSGE